MDIVRLTEVTDVALAEVNALLKELSPNSSPLEMGAFSASVASNEVELWVAKEDEKIVGMATLIALPKLSGLSGHVDDVVVASNQQGKGLGRTLMQKIIERANARGMRGLDLTSRASRVAANALYQKLGFERRDTNVYRMKLK